MTTAASPRTFLTALGLLFVMLVSACGSSNDILDLAAAESASVDTAPSTEADSIPETQIGDTVEIVFEPVGEPGTDPFTPSVTLVASVGEQREVDGDTQSRVAPGLYGGSGDNAVCDVELLIDYLSAHPRQGRGLGWRDRHHRRRDPRVHSLTRAGRAGREHPG